MNDKKRFAELMTAVGEYYGKDVSAPVLRLWWNALENYSDDDVSKALESHIGDTESGQFIPKIADIKRAIDGATPTTDQVIAAAMKPTTAIAVLCRIEIGTWNLDNWDRHQLKPLAESCIAQIPEWKQRIADGKLQGHEQVACLKYGVNPKSGRLVAPAKMLEAS